MEVEKRIRLKFDDDILTEAQALDGLIRSWILLKPDLHGTVSDVVEHLLNAFRLHQSCPDGLLLAVSGFLLPPFESTNIIKENEVIRVKKRRGISSLEGNNAAYEIKQLEAVRTQPVNTGVVLLANEEFEKERGGYESDDPEEESENEAEEEILEDIKNPSRGKTNSKHRKRKDAKKLKGNKKKRRHSEATGSVANNIETEKTEKGGGRMKKQRLSREERNNESNLEHNAENNEETAISSDQDNVSDPEMKSNDEEKAKETMDTKMSSKETRKGPSRSARRKYAKRQWLKEMKKIQMQNMNCESEGLRNWKEDKAKAEKNKQKWRKPYEAERNNDGQPKGLLHWKQSAQDDKFAKGKKWEKQNKRDYYNKHPYQNNDTHKQLNENSGPEKTNQNEGGLHEQPSPKMGVAQKLSSQNHNASEQPNEDSSEENEVVPRVVRPGHIRFGAVGEEQAVQESHVASETFQWNGITSKKKGQQWGKENHQRNGAKNSKKVHFDMLSNNDKQLDRGIDLDKLPPFTSIPKEGDFIAYRLLELSSTWTPELSALRVGKVSWYDDASNRIMLAPVPEYPIFSNNADKDENVDEAEQPDSSFYREDGSLEIEFSSLIDARAFNNRKNDPENKSLDKENENCVGDENITSNDRKTAPGNESLDKGNENYVGNENTTEIFLPGNNNEQIVSPGSDKVPVVETVESNPNEEMEPSTGLDSTNIWDEVAATINAKKEQLSKENGQGKTATPKKVQNAKNAASDDSGGGKKISGKPWKALRGSGLGPTMAILRSRNDI